jgi:hypothetical protein
MNCFFYNYITTLSWHKTALSRQEMKNDYVSISWRWVIKYLLEWIHWRFKFHEAILHEYQPANSVIESRSAAGALLCFQKWKMFPLRLILVKEKHEDNNAYKFISIQRKVENTRGGRWPLLHRKGGDRRKTTSMSYSLKD